MDQSNDAMTEASNVRLKLQFQHWFSPAIEMSTYPHYIFFYTIMGDNRF